MGAFTRPGTLTMPTVYAYNFTVQRQITSKFVVSGGYVGNSGRHMLLGTDENININQQYSSRGPLPATPDCIPLRDCWGQDTTMVGPAP